MSTGVMTRPPPKLPSIAPAAPRTVTVSGWATLVAPAVASTLALLGSECGAPAAACRPISASLAPQRRLQRHAGAGEQLRLVGRQREREAGVGGGCRQRDEDGRDRDGELN